MTSTPQRRSGRAIARALALAVAAALIATLPMLPANAVSPTPGTLYQLPSGSQCTKGLGNCVVYPKAASLPNGRLVAAFERSTLGPTGNTHDQRMPVYRSDDDGTTWQPLSEVRAPAFVGGPAQYTSMWTNPYLYVMPQTVGSLTSGTLVLAAVVSGADEYFLEQKAANPNWQADNDGDRRNVAIALYKSTDNGATWSYVNIVAAGGWQGGSAGVIGRTANANTFDQVDPVWEPYLMVRNNELIAYYSDENDYTGYAGNGALTLRSDNATAQDSHGQVVAHRQWNGSTGTAWSVPYVDVTGTTQTIAGVSQIGGGRPGMPNVVPTTNGQWLLTFEYFGGGQNVKQKIYSDPLNFRAVGGAGGTDIGALPVTAGSPGLSTGGSPVVIRMPDGRLIYNAAGSGDVWTNPSGSSTGQWTRQLTTIGGGYSRNLTYHPRTGRVVVLSAGWPNGGTVTHADIDFGRSAGQYFTLVNRKSGKVLDASGISLADGASLIQWANTGGQNQQWHVTDIGGNYDVILNRYSGRAVSVWQTSTADGAQVVQWVENRGFDQSYTFEPVGSYWKIRARHSGKLLTVAGGSMADGAAVIQWPDNGSLEQEWQLVPVP